MLTLHSEFRGFDTPGCLHYMEQPCGCLDRAHGYLEVVISTIVPSKGERQFAEIGKKSGTKIDGPHDLEMLQNHLSLVLNSNAFWMNLQQSNLVALVSNPFILGCHSVV